MRSTVLVVARLLIGPVLALPGLNIRAETWSDIAAKSNGADDVLTDIDQISEYWGQLRPYKDNEPNYFGVEDTGLPDGCQVEQVHILHRHAARYGTSASFDGANNDRFAEKVGNYTSTNPSAEFSGPLSFLKQYEYLLGRQLLLPIGAADEYRSGASFWQRQGRLLYNASRGQAYYNETLEDGTLRKKPVLRTTSQARILQSAITWAEGFFGVNATDKYDLVVIEEGGSENNTLASYDSCTNDISEAIGYNGDAHVLNYIPLYLKPTVQRLGQYFPNDFELNVNDTYAMQTLCAYETSAFGSSGFCSLFTKEEWNAFEYTLSIDYQYNYAFPNPTARAQGIGYVQELFARLNHQYINVSTTSVNSSLTNNPDTFPLGQPFYMDMSHDDILISVVTALSMDYFKQILPLTYPPPEDLKFQLSHLTPFATRLNTEVIGCGAKDPVVKNSPSTQYSLRSNGYNASSAVHKFIRMTWNAAPLPLDTIRGGWCKGRTDGLCPWESFKKIEEEAVRLANYQYACFGNWTDIPEETDDGTIFEA